ncbi:hypothetical protein SD77_2200 [Bacillus badius]|uniref:Uncharacterized protein n=1 Tax=Bacillus badius TaxID=1455 RepID=A0ABR5AYD3_BACBA|nr:hypothetical protein SD78_2336 [Bacillus badius]KIL79746.1 hypothetical protein SD77_2200 [Bacillus badius]
MSALLIEMEGAESEATEMEINSPLYKQNKKAAPEKEQL